jgi:cellulose synthase/poly-beta-1,6-N-acetylglucosamine synthase-like glycosyltransferase
MNLLRHKPNAHGIRRQWGADSHSDPMPIIPRIAGEWSMVFGRAAVVVTVAAWAALVITIISRYISGNADRAGLAETIGFLLAVTMLAASAGAYLVARLGFYYRANRHRRVPRAMIDDFFEQRQPTITALVPSYQEQPEVILMTLLSIALQEYPEMRVVLLVDDPPSPRYAEPRRLLEAALALPAEIEKLLSEPRERLERAHARFDDLPTWKEEPTMEEVLGVAADYEYASQWLRSLSANYEPSDHNEQFVATYVIGQLAADLAVTGAALRAAANDDPARIPLRRLRQLQQRLTWTFRAEISAFQRKQYASLSAEPNKAMNLNSYIGLMGDSYVEMATPAGRALIPAGKAEADMVVPESDYVMTVDADSVILPEYCLRLVYLMEREENERIAVAQSPYSAFPGASTRIERIAGATTDLQHIVHQGMTYHDASFWVGANAILRKRALDDISTTEYAGGFPIHRYISDNTVIEDTESTIDLAARGWTLHNYPERLAYSATPPDFGSLSIQRQRWANGGLLIIPKLIRCVRQRRRRDERTGLSELLLRLNYMASTFWASLFVLCLMVIPLNGHLISPLAYAVAIPYFLAMAVDLRYCGYKARDALQIYGFNLLLLPVNLAGSLSSVVQAMTGSKGRFIRTPKVRNRTVPAFIFVLLPYVLVAFSAYTFDRAYRDHQWTSLAFAAINAVLGAYAIVAFIGIRDSLVDLWTNVVSWLYKPQRHKPAPARRGPAPFEPGLSNWELVLYMGFADRRRAPRENAQIAHLDPDRPMNEQEIEQARIDFEDARAHYESLQATFKKLKSPTT